MKKSDPSFLLLVSLLFLQAPQYSYAQATGPASPNRPEQAQVIEELLNEVRQLRMALQRISINSYRAQVSLERLRLHHEQVTRLSQELGTIRSQLVETRAALVSLAEKMQISEERKEAGLIAESEVIAARAAMEELKQRELRLMEREAEIIVELSAERASLVELNRRLDALEREVVMTSKGEEGKSGTKREQQ